jgi:hypothetical protein
MRTAERSNNAAQKRLRRGIRVFIWTFSLLFMDKASFCPEKMGFSREEMNGYFKKSLWLRPESYINQRRSFIANIKIS